MKCCSKCSQLKPLDKFFRISKKYLANYCKDCRRTQMYAFDNSSLDNRLILRYRRLREKTRRENIPFDLTKEDWIELWKKQEGKCFYTGVALEVPLRGEGSLRNSLSVDRIVYNKGYTKDNVVFCTFRVNSAKADFTLEELQRYMPLWYTKISEINLGSANGRPVGSEPTNLRSNRSARTYSEVV